MGRFERPQTLKPPALPGDIYWGTSTQPSVSVQGLVKGGLGVGALERPCWGFANRLLGHPHIGGSMKAYCDNVIVSGSARGDLAPDEEMAATRKLLGAAHDGRLELVTSRFTRDEQGRTKDEYVRFQLDQEWPNWAAVENDTGLLGVRTTFYDGGFMSGPMLTEIVDEPLFAKLRAILPNAEGDARHLMYAVHNGCDYFVTIDTRDILPNRAALELLLPGLRLVRPSELASLFEAAL
jgi:hypothetical protein